MLDAFMNLLMAMGSMPPVPVPALDFGLGVTCGMVLGFAIATVFWIVIHYLSRLK